MGSLASKEGEQGKHFLKITRRRKAIPESHTSSEKDTRKDVSSGTVIITGRAKILMDVSYEQLWNNFLSCSANSFSLTPAEATALLHDSLKSTENGSPKQQDLEQAKEDIDSYMALIKELSGNKTISCVDFMAIFSSTLFLSRLALSYLYMYIYVYI
jgi:hypothetical protein